MTDMDEIIQDFLLESFESLEQFDRDMVALEQDPTSHELLSQVFRIVHTIKGTCGFLPFRRLEAVAHAGEELLTGLRRGDLKLDRELADALLELGDAIRHILRTIEATGGEGKNTYVDLVADLTLLLSGTGPATDPATSGPASSNGMAHNGTVHLNGKVPNGTTAHPNGAANSGVNGALIHNGVQHRDSTVPPDSADHVDGPGVDAVAGSVRTDGKIRVNVDLLDSMMNLVGELVLTRNQLALRATADEDTDLRRLSQRLRLITSGLQEGVMQARMQPIDIVWNKLPRIVRDLAVQLDKTVELDLRGSETELDRTILEAIKDPLTHIVRNAIDHGIETPKIRATAGKPRNGTLVVRAFHQGGLVNIEISDDGAGMDPDVLRQVAIQRGVVTPERAARLSEKESLALIFRPGFSTAAEVTNVSGRGVGMDVVKTNIERIGGLVDVESTVGHGTTFRIKIPLTLAIIPALVVNTHHQRYVIPQANVQELVQLGETEGDRIEHVHGAEVFRLRGELLPLIDLRAQLEHPASEDDRAVIAVLQADGRTVGLVVDTVVGIEEVVVKPLGKQLRDIGLFAGATTMGNGGIALILDVAVLAQRAGMLSTTPNDVLGAGAGDETSPLADHSGTSDDGLPGPDTVPLLLVRLADGTLAAMALAAVRRLEKIPTAAVDRVGTSYVVNYRDGLLPLVHAETALAAARDRAGDEADDERDVLTVIVCRVEGVTAGLVVSAIVDIVEGEQLATTRTAHGTHETAPVVIDGHVTEQLDLQDVLLAVDPHLLVHTTSSEALR